ncbi:MAG: hypothetical protein JW936_06520 [Sedimentisphaerales bacterium]|nr:hypothetical protein [Sedimentisphaerales bacterium]
MANGLRKLIKKAKKEFTKTSTLNRRFNRFGRLRAEELEERIAPALVLAPGEFVTWDTGAVIGDGAWDATDGFLALGASSSGIDSISVADFVDGGVAADTAVLNITVQDTSAGNAAVIVIASSQAIGEVNVSGLAADTTSLTLVIGSGITTVDGDGAASLDQDFTIPGYVADTATVQVATAASVGDPAIANTPEVFTGLANSGIGNITFGSITTANMPVRLIVATNGTGTLGNISSTDADVDLASTNGACVVAADSMGTFTWAGDVQANGGNNITFNINDGMGAFSVTGAVGGANGAILFDADADNNGGDIPSISVGDRIGDGAATVTFNAENIGTIDSPYIGHGAGQVAFTADDAADTDGGAAVGTIGEVGGTTPLLALGQVGPVVFTADDGMTDAIATTGSIAAGANVTFNMNADTNDDTGAMPAVTAGTTIGTAGANTLIINTNGTAGDNTTVRPVGEITANNGFARVDIQGDGTVGLLTVQGGATNAAELRIRTAQADATNNAPTNAVDFAGVNVVDTANNDSLTITAASEISGRIWNAAANGSLIAGGSDAGDVIDFDANLIIYNGDDTLDGAIDADYSAALPFALNMTTGAEVTGAGNAIVAARNASPLLSMVLAGETYLVDASTTPVTATLTLIPAGADERVSIDDLAGAGLGAATELVVSTSGASEFDVTQITRASNLGPATPSMALISIEGDLYGDIGEVANEFNTVEIIMIAGDASGGAAQHTFYGRGIQGLGTGLDDDVAGFSTLDMGPNVTISTLDRDTNEPLTLPGTQWFQFASAGVTQFNHEIIIVGGEAIVYGIDGAGNGDAGVTAPYEFSGVGQSGAAIDPAGMMAAAPDAMIGRIHINGVTGLATDVAVRETEGTTDGSWFEFETNHGLLEVSTPVSTVSVGIDNGSDANDNAVVTSIVAQNTTKANFDRLGGGEALGSQLGLNPATSVSDADAMLGNMIVQSMSNPGAANINVVVTGNSGPITLTGDDYIDATQAAITGEAVGSRDNGSLIADGTNTSAAIAIGGNLAGALTIPGIIHNGQTSGADILVGIAIDGNNDGDYTDTDETPSGSVNANIYIGDAPETDILVADDINNDVIVTGVNDDLEDNNIEQDGDLRGIKVGDELGNNGDSDVVVIAGTTTAIIADGMSTQPSLNSDIFIGGNTGGDRAEHVLDADVLIEGTGITSAAVIGGSVGVESVTIIDHEVFGDLGDIDYIGVTAAVAGGDQAGAIVVQWAANAFGNGTDTIGDVYIINDGAAAAGLYVVDLNGDAMDIGNVIALDAVTANFVIASPANVGWFVVDDDADVDTSAELLAQITGAYPAGLPAGMTAINNATIVYAPTLLDTAAGDDVDDLPIDVILQVQSSGGVIAEGDVEIVADIPGAIGDIISQDGNIDGDVHSGVSIGSIVASLDIDGEFIAEGVLAVTYTADDAGGPIGLYSLTGIPTWFDGGILSESGDIGENRNMLASMWTGTPWFVDGDNDNSYDNDEATEARFVAYADPTIVQGIDLLVDQAMGDFFLPTGSISATIQSGGDFGGINVPSGSAWVQLQVAFTADIDRIICPNNWHDAQGNVESSWNHDRTNVLVINGEDVVVVGAALNTNGLDVSVTGATTLAIVDGTSIRLVGGLAAGSTLDVSGDVNVLTVDGAWLGTINITPNPDDASNGEVARVVATDTIAVGADLNAFNFGVIDAAAAQLANVTTTGTFGVNEGVHWLNMAGQDQTLALVGGGVITTNFTRIFDKLTDVDVNGYGVANILSLNADMAPTSNTDWASIIDLYRVVNNVRAGIGDSVLSDDGDYAAPGTAHVDTVDINGTVMTTGLVVDGDAADINAGRHLFGLWVGGDAGDVSVTGGSILSQAFIRGDAHSISCSNHVMGLRVGGDVTALQAGMLLNSTVQGHTTNLNVNTHAIGNTFSGGVTAWNIGGFNLWNSGLI